MTTAAATKMAIPRKRWLGFAIAQQTRNRCDRDEGSQREQQGSCDTGSPLLRVLVFYTARNLRSTTTAEKSSMALSPPKASRAGLCACHAAKRDTRASTLIHAIVRALHPLDSPDRVW